MLIYTDNIEVIKAIEDKQSKDANSALVKRTKQLLKYKRLSFFKYVPRKNNQVADEITKLTSNSKKGVQNLEGILREILQDICSNKAKLLLFFTSNSLM